MHNGTENHGTTSTASCQEQRMHDYIMGHGERVHDYVMVHGQFVVGHQQRGCVCKPRRIALQTPLRLKTAWPHLGSKPLEQGPAILRLDFSSAAIPLQGRTPVHAARNVRYVKENTAYFKHYGNASRGSVA